MNLYHKLKNDPYLAETLAVYLAGLGFVVAMLKIYLETSYV